MKKNTLKLLVAMLTLTATVNNFAQEKEKEKETKLDWYGYVKADYIYDTRQTVSARQGNFFLYPTAPGAQNSDNNLNGFAIESRLGVSISGPDFFGMKTSGVVEGDFFGVSNADINGFHLRNAYIKLSNDKIDVLMGQFWHPMFVLNVSPSTYSFNAGTPYQPFNRSPQVRIETKGKNVRFIGALLAEMDFKTAGASAARSGLPAVHTQVQFGNDKKFVGGLGVNVKTVRIGGTKKDLTSIAYQAYTKANLGGVVWKLQGTYGGNMTELIQEGGFAMDTNNKYIANKTLSSWTEFSGDFSKSMEWGLFGGYTQNQGFDKGIATRINENGEMVNVQSGSNNVENSYRISPRIGWKSGKMKIGLEGDYSATQYGAINPTTGKFVTSSAGKVDMVRGVVSIFYTF